MSKPLSLNLCVCALLCCPVSIYMYSWLINEKSSRISIVTCHEVHKAIDPQSDVDIDELECILANLIQKVRNALAMYICAPLVASP